MNNNVYGIDLGTCNFKVFCKATGKILKEKNTVAIINKNEIYAYGDAAYAMYEKAVNILKTCEGGELEIAITYLNMASASEAQLGLLDADEKIQDYMDMAQDLLENYTYRGGYYAFVCEKCASVFGYYGRFVYEGELLERARRIYESEGN